MGYWFLLAAAGVLAVVIWDYRRKAAAREAASKARFEQMFKGKSAAPGPEAPAANVPAPAPGIAATQAPAPASVPRARERFLGQAETQVYRLLKAGIPDHEIFANVPLASVIAAPGGAAEREQQLRRLSRYQVDFVVCDKGMRIVAAVEVDSSDGSHAAGDRRYKADSLKSAGISLVRVNPSALPRREEIRALVCGPSNPPGS